MKRSTKITSIIIIFFLIITGVVVARTMIGNHFKKKYQNRFEFENRKFSEILNIEKNKQFKNHKYAEEKNRKIV